MLCRIGPVAISERVHPDAADHAHIIRTTLFYADFHFVPAALQNKKYTGYYHIKNTIGRTT